MYRRRRAAWLIFCDRNKNGIIGAVLAFAAIAMLATSQRSVTMVAVKPAGGFYANCSAARAAGVAPIMRDEPGYRPELDRDSDGVACEPWLSSENASR